MCVCMWGGWYYLLGPCGITIKYKSESNNPLPSSLHLSIANSSAVRGMGPWASSPLSMPWLMTDPFLVRHSADIKTALSLQLQSQWEDRNDHFRTKPSPHTCSVFSLSKQSSLIWSLGDTHCPSWVWAPSSTHFTHRRCSIIIYKIS